MIAAVIVAGGSGQRMRSSVRKQYLLLDGVPILGHTLKAFDRCAQIDRLVLVVPPNDIRQVLENITSALFLDHRVELVAGGEQRQDSVRNGLAAIGYGGGTVMIHDGVRPFVRSSLITACLDGVAATGACIPAVPATDTLKRVDDADMIIDTLERRQIQCAQTPQTFDLDLIRSAHRHAAEQCFTTTDDASVAEYWGARVKVVPGDRDNIKITTPADLTWAHWILDRWQQEASHRPH